MIKLCGFVLIITFIITILLLIFTNKSYFKNHDRVLIPLTFKNNMKNFMNNNFNDIKYFNDYKIINGISMPLDIKTDHTRDELNSKEHIENLTELFFLLNIFHNFSIKNSILYTISAGNILGYYSGCIILPWDDDIDVMVKDSDFDKINNIWNNGEPEYKIWDNNWTYKKIKLNSYNIILLKLKNRKFFKIKLSIDKIQKRGKFQKDIGGLDIEWVTGYGIGGQSKPLDKDIINQINNTTEKDYEIIQYGPIKTKIIRKEFALLLLNKMYPRWREKKHPRLFK